MVKRLRYFLALFALLSGSGRMINAEEPTIKGVENADLSRLVTLNNEFGMRLYQAMESIDGNLLISPYSLTTALQMLYEGSSGITQAQMHRILRLSFSKLKFQTAVSSLLQRISPPHLRTSDEPFAVVANSLWVQSGNPILPDFAETITSVYRANVKSIDFKNRPNSSRLEINEWVKGKSLGKIVDTLTPGEITNATRLVLVSIFYMRGRWENHFDPHLTRLTTFFPDPSRTVTLPMMTLTSEFYYSNQKNYSALELPLARKGGMRLSMYILLPNSTFGLKELESSLTASELIDLPKRTTKTLLTVTLPKFKFSEALDFKEVLRKVGLVDPFSERANFSAIDGTNTLKISNVVQKSYIAVDEYGTEAGVAAIVPFALKSAPHPTSKLFLVNHPFFFFIMDKDTGTFLLMGRVVMP